MTKNNRIVLASLLGAALLLPTQKARAQATPQTAEAAASDQAYKLPTFEIYSEKDTDYVGNTSLSSTRVAVDLSELSQSVKVLNNSFLTAINPTMMSDVLDYVGGGQNGQLNWTPGRMNIRGFTGDADYVDGFAPTEGSTVDSAIFDRFEVIKGPSTIFLAADGSPGGIVNKITKSPESTPETSISVQTGIYDGNHVALDTTGPITKDKKLLYRIVAGETYYNNGYYENVYMHRFTAMPELSYQFTTDTKLELKAELVQTNWPSYNGLPIDPRTNQMIAVPYDSSQDENAPYNWRHDDVKRVWGTFNTRINQYLALSIRGMDATDRADRVESITAPWNEGSRKWASATVTPTTYTGGAIPRSTTADDAHNIYRDLQADLNFNYTGSFFTELLLVGAEDRDTPSRTETYSSSVGTSSSPWYPFGGDPNPGPIVTVGNIPSAYTESQSLFQRVYVHETLKLLNDRVILDWGGNRASAYGSSFNYLKDSSFVPYQLYKNIVQAGIVVKVLPNVSLFAGTNQNFAANGVGTVNGVANSVLPPKIGQQHEVGLKSQFLDHRLSVNVSYFEIQQHNNTVPSFPLDPANPYVLIPGVISRGFDGDLSYKISSNLYLIGSFANYSAKSILGPAVNGTFIQPGTGSVAWGSIPVDNTAEQTESVYDFSRSSTYHGLSIGLGENFQSKRAITDGPDQVFWGYVPGRTLVDSSINYKANSHISYRLTINNLLNKKYIYSVRSENVIVPGTPINIKFEVTYSL